MSAEGQQELVLPKVQAVIAFLVTQWWMIPGAMRILVILMGIDYATGMILAFHAHTVSSNRGFFGLYKKGLILVLLLSANLLEKAVGTDLHLQQIGALAYCANEFISIIENCHRSGIYVPERLVSVLLNVREFRFQNATEAELAELRTNDAINRERDVHRVQIEDAADARQGDRQDVK